MTPLLGGSLACRTPLSHEAARAEPTVAPTVPRAPRQETLAARGGELVRAAATLVVGERAFGDVVGPARVAVVGARVVALAPGKGTWTAWVVDGEAATAFPTFLPRGSRAPTVLSGPGDAVWVVDADRRAAERLPLTPTAGRLVADLHVALPGDATGDVAVLADGRVAVSTSNQLLVSGPRGTRPFWDAESPIERVLAEPSGGLWALTRDGAAVHLTSAGTPDRTVSFEGTGLALAADGDELAVVSGTWSPGDRAAWKVLLVGPSGTRWSVAGEAPLDERTVVLLPDRVVVGGAARHEAFRRSDGAPVP